LGAERHFLVAFLFFWKAILKNKLYFYSMIHISVQEKLPDLINILKRHKVKRAYAFGSVCTPRFNQKSDVDLLISFEEGIDPIEYGDLYWSLDEKIPELLHHPVDILTEKQLRNPYFIKVMNKTKTALYE
jgi:predicted nucleotidyltransferase